MFFHNIIINFISSLSDLISAMVHKTCYLSNFKHLKVFWNPTAKYTGLFNNAESLVFQKMPDFLFNCFTDMPLLHFDCPNERSWLFQIFLAYIFHEIIQKGVTTLDFIIMLNPVLAKFAI